MQAAITSGEWTSNGPKRDEVRERERERERRRERLRDWQQSGVSSLIGDPGTRETTETKERDRDEREYFVLFLFSLSFCRQERAT